jgi:hypothetical protein
MAVLGSPFRLYRRQEIILSEGKNMRSKIIGAKAGVMFAIPFIVSIASMPAQASTAGITFSFAGTEIAPPVQSGATLIIDNSAAGSFLTDDPALNAIWNPVTFVDHCIVDLTTGFLNGTITFTFADGAKLFGNEFEDVRALATSGGIGPFTETFTFTGGTGEFAGATGSVSGSGIGMATGFTESGIGTLTAAGVSTPEPASVTLIFGGLLVMAGRAGRRKLARSLPFLKRKGSQLAEQRA